MKSKSYNILFRIFSFLSDKTNGAPFFVKYKLLIGTLIIGMAGISAKASEKIVCDDTTAVPLKSIQNTSDRIEIRGNVKDESGPLPEAIIQIKNSSLGVTADEDGNFSIKAKTADTLVFSYIGCETKEVPVSKIKGKKVTIVLKELPGLCYEVVVVKTSKKRKVSIEKNHK